MKSEELSPEEKMLYLFQQEVQVHGELISKALLNWEKSPQSVAIIEDLMRAAHSIKGAARIVHLDSVAQLAHAMEDFFIAVQKSKWLIHSNQIDSLLEITDFLNIIVELPVDKIASWATENTAQMEKFCAQMKSLMHARKAGQGEQIEVSRSSLYKAVAQSIVTEPKSDYSDAFVRVSPKNLSQITNFAAEALIENQRLLTSCEELLILKQKLFQMHSLIEQLLDACVLPSSMGLLDENAPFVPYDQPLDNTDDFSVLPINRDATRRSHLRLQERGVLLGEVNQEFLRAIRQCSQDNLNFLRKQIQVFENLAYRNVFISDNIYKKALSAQMRPLEDITSLLIRLVRDLARNFGKNIELEIMGSKTLIDRDTLESLKAPLIQILKNACDHGIEFPEERMQAHKPKMSFIVLRAQHKHGILLIEIRDDGRGIDVEGVRKVLLEMKRTTPDIVEKLSATELIEFLRLPGISTAKTLTEISGRGIGLDIVYSVVQQMGGHVQISTEAGQGTVFTLELPITRSVMRAVLVKIDEELYAFPRHRIEKTLEIRKEEIVNNHDRDRGPEKKPQEIAKDGFIHSIKTQSFSHEGTICRILSSYSILGLSKSSLHDSSNYQNDPSFQSSKIEMNSLILIKTKSLAYGIEVDAILDETDLVISPLDRRLGKVPHIAATSISDQGLPILILDVDDIIHSVENIVYNLHHDEPLEKDVAYKVRKILVIDDSVTIREKASHLLEEAGYRVKLASNGIEAWSMLELESFDLIITDIDMPYMNGYELMRRVRQSEVSGHIPIIILSYKENPEDLQKANKLGANIYLSKKCFQENTFLPSVFKLIGEPCCETKL